MESTPHKDESTGSKDIPAPQPRFTRGTDHGHALKTNEERSFAALLDRLGAPDDHHRLTIQNGDQAAENIELSESGVEIVIGFDSRGKLSWTGSGQIASACATVRHDWGGVHLIPNLKRGVRINGSSISAQQVLKNGDRIQLIPNDHADAIGTELVFREPLSVQVIPRVLFPANGEAKPRVSNAEPKSKLTREASVVLPTQKLMLGLFTAKHVAIIFVCTLLGAIAVFLALNWIDSQF